MNDCIAKGFVINISSIVSSCSKFGSSERMNNCDQSNQSGGCENILESNLILNIVKNLDFSHTDFSAKQTLKLRRKLQKYLGLWMNLKKIY